MHGMGEDMNMEMTANPVGAADGGGNATGAGHDTTIDVKLEPNPVNVNVNDFNMNMNSGAVQDPMQAQTQAGQDSDPLNPIPVAGVGLGLAPASDPASDPVSMQLPVSVPVPVPLHVPVHEPTPVHVTPVQVPIAAIDMDPQAVQIQVQVQDHMVHDPMNVTDPIPVEIPHGINHTESEEMEIAAQAVAEVEAAVAMVQEEQQQQEQQAILQAQAQAQAQQDAVNAAAQVQARAYDHTAHLTATVVTVVSPPPAAAAPPMPPMPLLALGQAPLAAAPPTTASAAITANGPVKAQPRPAKKPSHTLPSTDPAYRRKDKSLGVLCSNFMRRYTKIKTEHPHTVPEVTIDEASQSLMVERRRIYDIINILEAIEVVTRKGKNTYNWHGMSNITQTLRKMQKEAFELFPDDVAANQLKKEDKEPNIPTGFAMLLASAEQVDQTVKKGKEKSLGRLSQKFIQLFLVGNETITLEDASDKILGKTELPQPAPDATAEEMQKIRNSNNKMIKTKIRRLYDIANIMASVGLIAKLHSENQHVGSAPRSRPMFKWIYPLSATEILNCIDENGIVPVATADGGTVTKQVKIGENGVVENTIPVHDSTATISTRSGTPTPPNAHNATVTAAAAAAKSAEMANASITASLAATADAVVNAVDEQLAVANANANANAVAAAEAEATANAAKAAENAALIANAVVNGDMDAAENAAVAAAAVDAVQAQAQAEAHAQAHAQAQAQAQAQADLDLVQQQPNAMMENVDEVAAAAAAAVDVGEGVAAAAAAAAAAVVATVPGGADVDVDMNMNMNMSATQVKDEALEADAEHSVAI
jgi:hypothetical protein